MKLAIVILAAGQGKRMCSTLPKVLHILADKPLLGHVLETAAALQPDDIYIIYGHGGTQVQQAFQTFNDRVHWVEQTEQLGTGHAVIQAMPHITDDETLVLVLYGDVPLITTETLEVLCRTVTQQHALSIMTIALPEPTGYGRVVRDDSGRVERIVEERDTCDITRQIQEINTGILAAPAGCLRRWLNQLKNNNAQGEYYLTDIVECAVKADVDVQTLSPQDNFEVMGVNERSQLAVLERYYQTQQVREMMRNGATVRDPARLDIRGTVITQADVTIDVNVILEGEVKLGAGSQIGANCVIRNAIIGQQVEILAHCVLENVVIGDNCVIGPFARLRPDTVLAEQVRIGNFVEVKKAQVGQGSKINHLSYIGDSEVGCKVNIGAGTITCNYDGANKHKTVIGDHVFVGSDTQLIAPVTIETGATIGAGSTITHTVPAQSLGLSRSPQKNIEKWQRPVKKPA